MYCYLGPLWLTEHALNTIIAVMADKNELQDQDDRLTFFKEFVLAYYDLKNPDEGLTTQQEEALKTVFASYRTWPDLNRKRAQEKVEFSFSISFLFLLFLIGCFWACILARAVVSKD